MKKNIVYIAIILMVLAGTMLTLTGCGDSKETKETNKKVEYTEGMMNKKEIMKKGKQMAKKMGL